MQARLPVNCGAGARLAERDALARGGLQLVDVVASLACYGPAGDGVMVVDSIGFHFHRLRSFDGFRHYQYLIVVLELAYGFHTRTLKIFEHLLPYYHKQQCDCSMRQDVSPSVRIARVRMPIMLRVVVGTVTW